MTALARPILTKSDDAEVFELNNGDRMNQAEFHKAYLKTPPGFKAELIGGIVYVASPLHRKHGTSHVSLGAVLVCYKAATTGTECSDNTTVQLGYDAEPQPDLYLRVMPEYGGQSRNSEDGNFVRGAPELIVEVANSSLSIDLHAKRNDYRRFGVLEYIIACVREQELRWFDLRSDRELPLDVDKICRSRCFPGLWIDADALFSSDDARLLATAQRGLTSPEHADFVARLAAAKISP